MKIRMKGVITGTRNGIKWPAKGEVADLPAEEATPLLNAGLAEAVRSDETDTETATDADAEQTAPRRGRPRKSD